MAVLPEEDAALFGACTFDGGLVIAVSGGPDSMALMALMARWNEALSHQPDIPAPRLFVATIDHGLRPESAAEAALVAVHAATLGLHHATLHWTGLKPQAGLQDGARVARYALLVAHAKAVGASHLVTAHTLDDQAETLLMRLAAGSGPAGLAGMRPLVIRDGVAHWRPLLGVPKARLMATCEALGLPFVNDPSNLSPKYARGRWRQIMPGLAHEGLTLARLGRLAMRQTRAHEALDQAAGAALGEPLAGQNELRFAQHSLHLQPEEIRIRGLGLALGQARQCFAALDGDATGVEAMPKPFVKLERLEALAARFQQAVQLKKPFKACLCGMVIRLERNCTLVLQPELRRKRGLVKGHVDASCIASLGKGARRA